MSLTVFSEFVRPFHKLPTNHSIGSIHTALSDKYTLSSWFPSGVAGCRSGEDQSSLAAVPQY